MSVLDTLDTQLTQVFSQWSSITTALAVGLVSYMVYIIWNTSDPDTHPMLLLRQSHPSPVRQSGESAVYRSTEAPHGYPLKSGLNVKAPGAPLYAGGKDGDLRDIWRRVVGLLPLESASFGQRKEDTITPSKGTILTVLGREKVIEHDVGMLSKEINAIGATIKERGGKKVAVYLPNSVEVLSSVFAGAFYDFVPILLPFNLPPDTILALLKKAQADTIIAQAGSIPLSEVRQETKGIRQVIWVVDDDSKHVDWTSVEGPGLEVEAWHELVAAHPASIELPSSTQEPAGLVTVWQDGPSDDWDVVEFSQKNLVSAIAALTTSFPARARFSPSDLFLPASALSSTYTLTLTLAALWSGASVALTSVAGPGVSLAAATRIISPTIISIETETAIGLHDESTGSLTGLPKRYAHKLETQSLSSGIFPAATLLSKINAPTRASIGAAPGQLRLLCIASSANGAALTSRQLSDLRIFSSARCVHALTHSRVAGAVTQTHLYDYRIEEGEAHYGAPLSSVEVKVVDQGGHKTTDLDARGEIVVEGPAVASGSVKTGLLGRWRDDGCLALL